MAAEALGVFFYVYPGIASQASFFLNGTEPQFGSIFQIGWAYAIGIYALNFIVVCLHLSQVEAHIPPELANELQVLLLQSLSAVRHQEGTSILQ
jgi:glycerol uptake facilitator-like aquaporin